MAEGLSVLALTIIVMTAGSALYTIKTYIRPGMKLALNLAELQPEDLDGKNIDHFSNEEFKLLMEKVTTNLNQFTIITSTPSSITDSVTVKDEKENNLKEKDERERNERERNEKERNEKERNEKEKEVEKENDKSERELTTQRFTSTVRFNIRKPMKPTATQTQRPLHSEEESSVFYDITLKPTLMKRNIIETKLGLLEGIEVECVGKKILAFLGIKYGQAALGDQRFRKTKLVQNKWDGIKQANQFGELCVQYFPNSTAELPLTLMRKEFSEDCLHLNVWTPATEKPLKTVIFFIHGGLFTFGSNSIDEQDGRMLASFGDVVVVSINYRLGPFGFLKSGTNDTPGNQGLDDIILALKWVKYNIESFGGDPKSVTVLGHEAGAMAASILMMSNHAKGLFKRMILQSGSSAVFNFYYEKSLKSTEQLADLLKCIDGKHLNLTSNPEAVMHCIRTKSNEMIEKAIESQLINNLYSYSPSIGDDILPRSPKDLLEDGNQDFSDQKEILIGSNSDEASLFFHLGNPNVFKKDKFPLINDIDEAKQLLSDSLKDFGFSKNTLQLMGTFFYEKLKIPNTDPKIMVRSLIEVFTDFAFVCPSVYFSEKFSQKNNRTSYYYYFTHRSSSFKRNEWFGASHFDEIPFVFGHPLRYPNKYSGTDIDLSKVIMLIWTTFAKTGKPPSISGKEWPKHTEHNQEYVELNGRQLRDGKLRTGIGPHKDSCNTWKYAFRLFN